MKNISKKQIMKYYNSQASCQVLGCLMNNPSIVRRKEYNLNLEDFIGDKHILLFTCVYNLVQQGLKEIAIGDIETYLSTNDLKGHDLFFNNEQNFEWLNMVYEDANLGNFEYYYGLVRKMALLRGYLEEGFDVRDILDIDEIDHIIIKEQNEKLDIMTIEEIKRYFDKKAMRVKQRFDDRDETNKRKSGEKGKELRQLLKESPSYGFNLESNYLNTVSRGALPKKFFLESRDSGTGKTRVAMRRLLGICSPYLWDFKTNKYIENPNGKNNTGLYIGTEMELYEELEPMIWAFISGVEEDRIRNNILTEEEENRVDMAIEYSDQMQLFLEDEENYDLSYLWSTVEQYKEDYNISVVAIDYLELTAGLVGEYSQLTRGMSVREDQVLLNLSTNIKNICKKFDLTIFGFTQTTDEARRDGVRDQRAIKGARSLPNKCDVGITVFEPTNKEMELIEPLIKKCKGINNTIIPNACYTIYKNRGNVYKNMKIWGHNNLGNGRFIDLFCTDNNYNPINIEETFIELEG